ncbi:hypothetical protein ACTBIF_006353, partial [Pseudomonas aeruginosa]
RQHYSLAKWAWRIQSSVNPSKHRCPLFNSGPSKQGCKAALFGWTSLCKAKSRQKSFGYH